ncbi:uncharacterized protein G2W53_004647 [Senna tora]|uniref:Uncharacterized protein n=1 Tax=Senna tora TaxID=362788 RepID=A0A834XC85_9FABA|nr:uncharacterized protein G2W53_004647 [Senna tora]
MALEWRKCLLTGRSAQVSHWSDRARNRKGPSSMLH